MAESSKLPTLLMARRKSKLFMELVDFRQPAHRMVSMNLVPASDIFRHWNVYKWFLHAENCQSNENGPAWCAYSACM